MKGQMRSSSWMSFTISQTRSLWNFWAGSGQCFLSEGRLIIRVTIPGEEFRLFRFVEVARLRFKGVRHYFRRAEQIIRILEDAGFKVGLVEPLHLGERRPGLSPVPAIEEAHPLDQTED